MDLQYPSNELPKLFTLFLFINQSYVQNFPEFMAANPVQWHHVPY